METELTEKQNNTVWFLAWEIWFEAGSGLCFDDWVIQQTEEWEVENG